MGRVVATYAAGPAWAHFVAPLSDAAAKAVAGALARVVTRSSDAPNHASKCRWQDSPWRLTLVFVTSTAKKILDEALTLPQEEREKLLGALSDSLEPVELTPEWEAEIAGRIQRIENGEAVFHDANEHLRNLRVKYGG